MATKKKRRIKIIAGLSGKSKRKVRKHLSADSLIAMTRKEFQQIQDHRADNSQIALDDILMSAFAMFSLKDPSLPAFDKRRQEEPENLHTTFSITDIPCDSQMRTTLDPMDPARLRSAFQAGFRQLQRGKAFEKMVFLDDHYLLSGDGTGF